MKKYFATVPFLFSVIAFADPAEIVAASYSNETKKQTSPSEHLFEFYAGPHFNYMKIDFFNPSDLQGYAGGVTTGIEYNYSWFRTALGFEGTWNAGPITGEPAQRSDIYEYFTELQLGPVWKGEKWQFAPYTGFGWDRFNNEVDPKTASLDFRYDKLFVPIGFYLNRVYPNFTVGFQFAFRPDVYQNLRLLSVDLDPEWGYAFRTQLFLKQYFPLSWGRVSINFVPFFDWNKFGEVNETNSFCATLHIPELLYWKLGLRFLLGFEF